jgi:hypothetical protein
MGMAASQARYLGLTARKTNVEYEGQQINQARVALANQSANTFNQLLALTVPTAPDKTKFTELQYSYIDGTYGETITRMDAITGDPNYNYIVTHHHYADMYRGIESKRTNPQVALAAGIAYTGTVKVPASDITEPTTGTYQKNGVPYTTYNAGDADQLAAFNKLPAGTFPTPGDVRLIRDTNGTYHFVNVNDLAAAVGSSTNPTEYIVAGQGTPTYVGNSETKLYDATDPDLKAAYEQIKKDWPETAFAGAPQNEIYYWKDVNGKTYFACQSDLMVSANSGHEPDPLENQERLIQYNAQTQKEKIEKIEKAMVDLDDKGRPQSVRYTDSSAVYTLKTETVTDEDAYNDAMNQYYYDVQVYEKNIEDINAKTKIIQEQDRTLELRLRQLDTEQDALQTEMEAVKKVIEKNIESTFKTFE